MAQLVLDSAEYTSVILQAVLYGFSVFMFAATMWVLTKYRSSSRGRWIMMLVAVVLLFGSTAHLITDIARVQYGVIRYRDTFNGGPPAYFEDTSQAPFVIRSGIYAFQTLVGDGILIYRCYAVWQSVWIVVLPIMGWCSTVVTGICAPYYNGVGVHSGLDATTIAWIKAFYASTFATSTLTTLLLASRIWQINRRVKHIRVLGYNMNHTLVVILDAGLIYSTDMFVLTILFARQSTGERLMYGTVCPISSVFYMVIIRCGTVGTNSGAFTMTTQAEIDFNNRNKRRQSSTEDGSLQLTRMTYLPAYLPTVK